MENLNRLCTQFKDSLIKEESFDRENVIGSLSSEDRVELANLILQECEKVVLNSARPLSEEMVLHSLSFAEELAPSSAELICREAALLFRIGLLQSAQAKKGHSFLLALDKITRAEVVDDTFFEKKPLWWHLWGNILVALSQSVGDETYLVNALTKFERGAQVAEKEEASLTMQLYWDFGNAWIQLGKNSQEIGDIQKGIEKFRKAASLGCSEPNFRIDYGESLVALVALNGETCFLEEATKKFKRAISETYSPDGDQSPTHVRGWMLYAKTAQKLAECGGEEEEADKVFQDAIIALPDQAELWLDWGELFLRLGWIQKNLSFIETALEKLTSAKVSECDPLRTSALLGQGMTFLGLFIEDLKLLREGEERISAALDIAPENNELILASALSALAFGLYFSEASYFEQAAYRFRLAIAQNSSSPYPRYGLFQSYLFWGVLKKNSGLIQKGLQAIARTVELTPHSGHFWSEWGVALMQLDSIEKGQAGKAIEKFKQAIAIKDDLGWLFNYGSALDALGDQKGDEFYYDKAIHMLSHVYEKRPNSGRVRYQLALAYSHRGELTSNVENLYHAADLFEAVVRQEQDDDVVWCEWGYTLLNLAELISDPVHPEKGQELRKEAESRLMRAAKLGNGPANYHLACLYSLSGIYNVAMDYLKRAELSAALPAIEDIESDEWLEDLRQTTAFQEFLEFRRG